MKRKPSGRTGGDDNWTGEAQGARGKGQLRLRGNPGEEEGPKRNFRSIETLWVGGRNQKSKVCASPTP